MFEEHLDKKQPGVRKLDPLNCNLQSHSSGFLSFKSSKNCEKYQSKIVKNHFIELVKCGKFLPNAIIQQEHFLL